jgi:hypothetical protein
MDTQKILEIIGYAAPALITGGIALYYFKYHMLNEDKRRTFLIQKENQNIALPLRLQAYERLALFLERISPAKLLVRVKPTGDDSIKYHNKLLQSIEQEFEHNLAQQIYVSDDGWNAVVTAKNAISQIIRTNAAKKEIKTAKQLQESIIQNTLDNENPATTALYFVKNEVRKLF